MKKLKLITICAVVGMLLTVSADVKGAPPADPCLWLQFEGADGATATVDSSPHNHAPITFNGSAQLDTAYQVVGYASLLNGGSDYLTIDDVPADWNITANTTDSWTIDFFVRHNAHSAYDSYLVCKESKSLYWRITHEPAGLGFYSPGSGVVLANAAPITDPNWHWVALCKVGNEYGMYKDGQQINYTGTGSGSIVGTLSIGGLYFLDGNMDELRITHGNLFDAAPNADMEDFIQYNVPEPATMALLTLGGLAMLRRRNRFSANAKSR